MTYEDGSWNSALPPIARFASVGYDLQTLLTNAKTLAIYARQETEDAIEQARINADQNWMVWALQAAYMTATHRDQFTADDVWVTLQRWKPDSDTHERRAMGPILREAARRGWIASTGTYATSRRRSRHCGPVLLWKSTITADSEPLWTAPEL